MRVTRARRRPPRVRGASSSLLIVAALSLMTIIGFAAANTVPASKAADRTSPVTAEQLKPNACMMVLSALVTGSGTFGGGDAAELILGSSGADTITGGKGDDCIVGGGGNDSLRGDQGNDVCIGNSGTTFHPSCETQIII